jgi:hypothetical protein
MDTKASKHTTGSYSAANMMNREHKKRRVTRLITTSRDFTKASEVQLSAIDQLHFIIPSTFCIARRHLHTLLLSFCMGIEIFGDTANVQHDLWRNIEGESVNY